MDTPCSAADSLATVEKWDKSGVALHIVDILAMRGRGTSYPKIAQALTERGIPTKRGGTRWQHATIAGLVQRHEQRGDSIK